MGKIDIAAKSYFSDLDRFADIFNFWIYDGENIIQPSDLTEMDTTEIALPYGNAAKTPIQKFRDVLKLYTAMQDSRAIYLVLGLEAEAKTNYAMVVKNMLYDAMNYSKQVASAAASHRTDAEAKPTSDEFLSGFWKEDRLVPVMTLVVNISGKAWDGAKSLHDMFALTDKRFLTYIPNYRLNLLSPDQIDEQDFGKFRTGFGTAMQFIKHQHDDSMDWMKDQSRFERVDRPTAEFIQTATGTKMQFDERDEVINMCRAWENSMNQAKNDGIQQGIGQGKVDAVLNVAKKFDLSVEEAMDAVGIKKSEWDVYSPMIQQRMNANAMP